MDGFEDAQVVGRASWIRNVSGALPLLLASAVYFAAWRADWLPPGMTYSSMTQVLQLEFLALHAGVFLGLLVVWEPDNRTGQRTRWVLFAVLLALYIPFAMRYGPGAALTFLVLILGTYLGWMLNRRAETERISLFVRWGAMLLLMVVLVRVIGMPKNVEHWVNSYGVYRLGAWYFLAIGLLEAVGFYQLRIWARLAETGRTRRG